MLFNVEFNIYHLEDGETDLRLAVHCEAEQAVVSLKSGWISPDRHILLPQQSGQA